MFRSSVRSPRFGVKMARFSFRWACRLLVAMAAALLLLPASLVADDDRTAPDHQLETIDALIRQLGSDSFSEREQAQTRLAEFGFAAFDALLAAEQDDDIEVAARARYLVRLMQVQWVQDDDPAAVKTLLVRYDSLEEPDRLDRVRRLARLSNDEGLAPLCRLVRYEKSEILSKWAAVELIKQPVAAGTDRAARGDKIVETLARSPRPAAAWLRLYARAHENPERYLAEWNGIVDAEQATFEQFPDQSRAEFLVALLREQIQRLDELDRDEEVLDAMRRIVQFERGETEPLLELLAWLVERKAWSVVDDLARRFSGRIHEEPLLLYALADARILEGREADAEALAKQALTLNATDPADHLQTAQTLRQRGQPRWAEAELRHVIETGQADNGTVMLGCYLLADLIYDRAEYLAAAQLLEEQIKKFAERMQAAGGDVSSRNVLDTVRKRMGGRMHYYYAMHFHELGEFGKETENLDRAIESDPQDIDVLIALHRLPKPGEERQRKTEKMIEDTVSSYEQLIQNQPDNATNYNQLAWLWANTGRKQQQALEYSRRSLELSPNESGYLDTLARCYYALGQLDKAVAAQLQAVSLDPHSGQMNRQLKQFQQELAKKRESGGKS
ncbi:MAG: tetratricopeptide repeat protein [Pirellulales bacterium]|nr:tetratricopeptide repeat protein [Pirellulales bacterium]